MHAALGVKLGPQHDTGACVVWESGGRLRCVAISEERLTRKKHSREFPARSIADCLSAAGLKPADIKAVLVDKLDPRCATPDVRAIGDIDAGVYSDDERRFFADYAHAPCGVINHHLCHAASAFHPARSRDAAVLVVDGHGSHWPLDDSPDRAIEVGPMIPDASSRLRLGNVRVETQSIFHGQGRTLTRRAVSTQAGLGLFYTWVTKQILNFAHLQEGKAMGLSAYADESALTRMPRVPSSVLSGVNTLLLQHLMESGFVPTLRTSQQPTDRYFADAAYWAQSLLTSGMTHLARHALELCPGARNLGIAGGVALNIVANREILPMVPGEFFIQPAASDAGTPLGCALHAYYSVLSGTAEFQDEQVFLGPVRDERHAEEFLLARGGVRPADLSAHVASLLAQDKIIGWWQGGGEYGPRALGHRSILCSPLKPWMKDHLNANVKHREGFRPFAPIVPVEHAKRYFDLPVDSPFMLLNAMVREPHRTALPAITHEDGSARLQTIAAKDQPRLHSLLEAFGHASGYPVLLNTSFNIAGEPIVETVEDAHRCFMGTGIDVLVCGGVVVTKR